MTCFVQGTLVEERVDRVLTQYRESPNLLHLLRTYLQATEDMAAKVCDLPEKFDLDSAVGDQLTLIGKRLGWPRCHCVCVTQPYFGFDCEGVIEHYQVSGFCDNNVTWVDCGGGGVGEVCINDDELYGRFLKVRRRQYTGHYALNSLTEAAQELFGVTGTVLDAGRGRVVIAPGRDLSDSEIAVLQLFPRVLPIALGVEVRFHFGDVDVFGFGGGWGGFCEPWADAVALTDETGALIVDESGLAVSTGVMTRGATWMCEVDVRPYDC